MFVNSKELGRTSLFPFLDMIVRSVGTMDGSSSSSYYYYYFDKNKHQHIRAYRSYTNRGKQKKEKRGQKKNSLPQLDPEKSIEVNYMCSISACIHTLTHIEKLFRNKIFSF